MLKLKVSDIIKAAKSINQCLLKLVIRIKTQPLLNISIKTKASCKSYSIVKVKVGFDRDVVGFFFKYYNPLNDVTCFQ